MSAGRAVRAGWLLLVAGGIACSEAPEAAPDLSVLDAATTPPPTLDLGAPDARPPQPDAGAEGQACTSDDDCLGICLTEDEAPRCATPCADDAACGDGRICGAIGRQRVCVEPPRVAALGEACDVPGLACEAPGLCVADTLDGALCRAPCSVDSDCAAGSRCATEAGACLPAEADPFTCARLGCLDPALRCVRLSPGAPARCLSACFDRATPCPDGTACVGADGLEGFVCEPGVRAPGDPCGSGGQCSGAARCLARAPGDPLAVCALPCMDGGCDDGFACRRPTGLPEAWCVPAPFGQGDQSGDAGSGCARFGATDCLPELDCVRDPAGLPVCSAPCDDGACDPGQACARLPIDGPHCVRSGPDFGGQCVDHAECASGVCWGRERPGGGFCSQACPPDCPADGVCDAGWCRPLPPAEQVAPGEPCGPEVDCAAGVCATDPADGVARCAIPCGDEARCEAGFECRPVAGQPLCFPSL